MVAKTSNKGGCGQYLPKSQDWTSGRYAQADQRVLLFSSSNLMSCNQSRRRYLCDIILEIRWRGQYSYYSTVGTLGFSPILGTIDRECT